MTHKISSTKIFNTLERYARCHRLLVKGAKLPDEIEHHKRFALEKSLKFIFTSDVLVLHIILLNYDRGGFVVEVCNVDGIMFPYGVNLSELMNDPQGDKQLQVKKIIEKAYKTLEGDLPLD